MSLMGIFIFITSGFNWLILILLFLILGVGFTQFKKDYKRSIGIVHEQRTVKNVISNGIVPILMAVFGNYGGFIGSVSSATADTLASEIGVLSKPRLITNNSPVKEGSDGGISILGTSAALAGTIIIGISSYFLGIAPNIINGLLIAIISGMAGCFLDSLLGATLEQKGILNNEHVNLASTILGATIGFILTGV